MGIPRRLTRIGFVTRIGLLLLIVWVAVSGGAEAAGPTSVSGTIDASTTWTPAGSPYVVTGDVTVKAGATLTVEAGARIEFQRVDNPKGWTRRAVLRVLGNLVVSGSEFSPVTFTLHDGNGIGDWGGIWIDGVLGGTADMRYATVEYAERGIYVSGSAPVMENLLVSNNLTGIYLESVSGLDLSQSNLSLNEYGIMADRVSGRITHSVVSSNTWGIYILDGNGFFVEHTDVKSNTFGVVHDGGTASLTYNDFSIRNRNDYGVFVKRDGPVISHNNFYYDNGINTDPAAVFWYVYDQGTGDVQAPDNWWDTTNTTFIQTYIYDGRDRVGLGKVYYDPPAMEPVMDTIDNLRPPAVTIVGTTSFSPNADQRMDTGSIIYSLSEDASDVLVKIIDVDGNVTTAGSVIWERTSGSQEITAQHLTDGTHDVYWDGTVDGTAGTIVADGRYKVVTKAWDIDKPYTYGRGEGYIRVDTNPPTVQVDTPATDTITYYQRTDVSGTVSEDGDSGVSVQVSLKPAVIGGLGAGQFSFHTQVVLKEGPNRLSVRARDGAGNEAETLVNVIFEPVVSIEVTSPTNATAQTVGGEVRSAGVASVTLTVQGPDGTVSQVPTVIQAGSPRRYASTAPVTMGRGDNIVIATGYDSLGSEIGATLATVTYDPLIDRTLRHTVPNGLRMISLPITPDNGDPVAVFGMASPPLARWNPELGQPGYEYFADGTLGPIQAGQGYWLKLDPQAYPNGLDLTVTGRLTDERVDAVIPVVTGWNQIGNPFTAAVDWSGVKVRRSGESPISLTQAVAKGWIGLGLWGYGSTGYEPVTTMAPWSGYWVRVQNDVDFLIPPPGGVQAFAVSKQATPVYTWRLQLAALLGDDVDGATFIGMSAGASPGFDVSWDMMKPPPTGGAVRTWLADDLAQDIRGSGDDHLKWRLTVQASAAGKVRLVWPELAQLQDQVQLTLTDEATGKTTDMGHVTTYSYQTTGGEQRRFTLQALAAQPLQMGHVVAYPNPTRMSSPIQVRFSLNRAATVRLKVFNALGRVVRDMTPVWLTAGTHDLSWDGTDGQGRAVANGLYIFRLTAVSGSERQEYVGRIGVLR